MKLSASENSWHPNTRVPYEAHAGPPKPNRPTEAQGAVGSPGVHQKSKDLLLTRTPLKRKQHLIPRTPETEARLPMESRKPRRFLGPRKPMDVRWSLETEELLLLINPLSPRSFLKRVSREEFERKFRAFGPLSTDIDTRSLTLNYV